MKLEYISTIGGFLVALIGLFTGFVLQRDQRKMRDLERENKRLKNTSKKALYAIKGYQQIEEAIAKEQNINVAVYRRNIRNGYQEYFDSDFLSPANLDTTIKDIETL